jgi:hypothetical protein
MATRRNGLYRPDGRRLMGRPAGCLVLIVFLLVLLVVLSIMFGGFQNGTRSSGAPRAAVAAPPR